MSRFEGAGKEGPKKRLFEGFFQIHRTMTLTPLIVKLIIPKMAFAVQIAKVFWAEVTN
jgi:hypothetical protein